MGLMRYLPKGLHGVLMMFTGAVILLYMFNFVQAGLKYFIILVALYMIVDGFVEMDGIEKIQELMKKYKSNEPKE